MGEIKEKIKIFVNEANVAHIFREKIKVKVLKITETLIQAIQKLISLIKIFLKISP